MTAAASAALRDRGVAVLLVEQLAEQALQIADHVSVLNKGVIVGEGPPAQFSDLSELQRAYFGGD